MDWQAPQLPLRRFEFSFPAVPPDEPSAEPAANGPSPTSQGCFDAVCYGASTDHLLWLTRSSHPLFGLHCFTGLQSYAGAELLARLLRRRPQVLRRGRAVLEIGCGIGLTGVVAAHCMSRQQQQPASDGAASAQPLLLLTDGEEDAVRLARCNVRLNWRSEQRQPADEAAALQFLRSPLASSAQIYPPPTPPPSAAQRSDPSDAPDPHPVPVPASLSVHALSARWNGCGVSTVSSYCAAAVGRPIRFDVAYGCDLFYARTAVDDVLSFAQPLLADTGVLLLAHTPRTADLHCQLRSACRQRSLSVRYVAAASFIGRAEEVERGWTQVEVAVIAGDKGWDALTQSADWQWAVFESEGRVERQQAEDERRSADESVAFSAVYVADYL